MKPAFLLWTHSLLSQGLSSGKKGSLALPYLTVVALSFLPFYCAVDPVCFPHASKCHCSSGYKWNAGRSTCEDVNECMRAKLNLCPASSVCLNLEGSYQCKAQGKGNACDVNPCKKYGECKQVDHNGSFICSCKPGFKYNGNKCIALTGCGKCGISYTATNKSESMQSIASYCGIRLTTLIRLNPAITRHLMVQKGQLLNISCTERDTADCGPCGVGYTPSINDTFSSISEHCGIDELYLRRIDLHANKLDLPCGLSRFPKVLQCGFCGSSVQLSAGPASLKKMSKSCNVSLEQIQSLNPALNDLVGVNTTVYLPCINGTNGCGPCGAVYKVMLGDTAEVIATKCGVSLSAISQANPQVNNIVFLDVGQLLSIPCGLALPSHASATDMVKLKSWIATSSLSFMIAIFLF